MARDEIFEVAKREHPAPANFADDRAPVFPDQVAERLLCQPKRIGGCLVVKKELD
jgi:hypothetical protein